MFLFKSTKTISRFIVSNMLLTHLELEEDTEGGQMGMIHCTQTDHSLVLELFQDATQTVRSVPCLENNSKKEWKRR